jgi:hypothetical protein
LFAAIAWPLTAARSRQAAKQEKPIHFTLNFHPFVEASYLFIKNSLQKKLLGIA